MLECSLSMHKEGESGNPNSSGPEQSLEGRAEGQPTGAGREDGREHWVKTPNREHTGQVWDSDELYLKAMVLVEDKIKELSIRYDFASSMQEVEKLGRLHHEIAVYSAGMAHACMMIEGRAEPMSPWIVKQLSKHSLSLEKKEAKGSL